MLYEQKDIAERWQQYLVKLYRAEGEVTVEEEDDVDPEDRGDCILRDEFHQAAKQFKYRKFSGIDELPAELIKNASDTVLNELFNLVSKIHKTA